MRVFGVGVEVDMSRRVVTFSVLEVAHEIPLTEVAATTLTSLAELAMSHRGSVDGHITETQGQSLSLEFENGTRNFGSRGQMQGPPGDVIEWLVELTGVPRFR